MDPTLGAMLTMAARRYGDRPLVVAVDRVLTFAELDRLSTRLAFELQRVGVRGERPVTLWLENGWRWMAAYYAILKLGAIVNPCNVLLTPDEVRFIMGNCGAGTLIAAAEKARLLGRVDGVTVVTDRATAEGAADLDSLLADAGGGNGSMAVEGLTAKSAATIGYTSGTTGHPKGAVLRHSTIVLNTAMTSLMHGRGPGDVVVSALPCSHVYGNIVMNSAVLRGMTLVLLPKFDEQAVLAAIERHRATMLEGVPTMFVRILNHPDFDRFDLSSLRICTVGGQTMPVATMEETERRFGCPLLELWGMTELGGLGTTHPHNGPRRLGSIGVPLPLTQARIVAIDDASREVPAGEVGELMIRGPLVMQGYFGDSEATRATIEPDGWMHTGDLARQDADGYLYVVDRAKEVIITGGYNVYPAEVERVIAEHPAVAMVAVAAMHDAIRGQSPKAFVVARNGARCTAEDIIEHCRPRLAAYKVPRAVEFLDDLPRNSTGKILRRALSVAA